MSSAICWSGVLINNFPLGKSVKSTGEQGLIENVAPRNSSNIWRITGDISVKKALAKNKLKPLGATMARYLEERYHQLPFAERWAFPLLQKPFPNDKDESLQNKWDAHSTKNTQRPCSLQPLR